MSPVMLMIAWLRACESIGEERDRLVVVLLLLYDVRKASVTGILLGSESVCMLLPVRWDD